jgi:hypothetical protein
VTDEEGLVHTPHTPLDPSSRTLETLHREIENVSDRLETLIGSEARLRKEKFDAVALEFALVERMRVEQKRDTQEGVSAALVAAKDAVAQQTIASEKSTNKSEIGTDAKISALDASFGQRIAGQGVQIDDVKERLTRLEAGGVGRNAERIEHRGVATLSTNIMVGVGLVVVGTLSLIAPHIH